MKIYVITYEDTEMSTFFNTAYADPLEAKKAYMGTFDEMMRELYEEYDGVGSPSDCYVDYPIDFENKEGSLHVYEGAQNLWIRMVDV